MWSLARVVAAVMLAACADSGPGVPRYVAVSAGSLHSCAITGTGRILCWGRNSYGALGTGDTTRRRSPTPVASTLAFRKVSAGFLHSCALRTDGTAFCWGINGLGELGDGSTQDRSIPVPVTGINNFVEISAGEGGTCGIAASDSGLFCWGADLIGVNAPPGRDHTRPGRYAPGRFRSVSVGYEIACALRTDGQAICWGYGAKGQLGNGDTLSSDVPVYVTQPGPFRTISTGHDHSCGQTADGTAWCWGANFYGQLGATAPVQSSLPVQAVAGLQLDSITAHTAAHSCALVSGTATCWGANGGRLGDGTTAGGPAPRPVSGGLTFRQISGGFSHSCGVATDGGLWCWGDNSVGQLGTGHAVSSLAPTPVAPLP